MRVISLHGELDAAARDALWTETWDVLDSGSDGLVVDLSGTTSAESRVLATVVAAAKACKRRGGEFVLVDGETPMRRVVRAVGLDRRLTVTATLAAAISALTTGGAQS